MQQEEIFAEEPLRKCVPEKWKGAQWHDHVSQKHAKTVQNHKFSNSKSLEKSQSAEENDSEYTIQTFLNSEKWSGDNQKA